LSSLRQLPAVGILSSAVEKKAPLLSFLGLSLHKVSSLWLSAGVESVATHLRQNVFEVPMVFQSLCSVFEDDVAVLDHSTTYSVPLGRSLMQIDHGGSAQLFESFQSFWGWIKQGGG
jgi:hypothetical protein